MGHRAKHRRENWVPERLAAAEERAKAERARQAEAAARRAATEEMADET